LSALLPTNSLALGLGEIEVNSFLNQPLNAEIEVISARPGEIDDLLVSLASREAFARAGLARPRYLLDLRFAVKKNEEGDEAVIVVTTKSGVKEPFLNFLIEADWSKGRVLREFTILLDPPFFADQPVPIESTEVAAQPVAQPITEEASVADIVEQAGVTTMAEADTSEPVASDEPVPEPIVNEPIALSEDDAAPLSEDVAEPEESSVAFAPEPSPGIVDDDDILVSKGDTLWSIASRFKDDSHSMAQVMLAFQRTNPDAFNDGNINNMKEGAILRVPDSYEFDAIGQQEAYAEVLTQNGLWDEYVARVTGVSPAVASDEDTATEMAAVEQEAAEVAEEGGELSLLLPGEGDSESTGTGDTGDVDELRTKLALAEEELEASRIENRELESRISELQARLSKVEELQKMVEIEDDSLAQMQADQVEQAEQEATEGIEEIETEAADAVGDAIQADEEALLEELLAEEAAAQAEEQTATEGKADDEMVSDEMVSEEATTEPAMVDEGFTEQAATDDAMAEDEAVTPPPAPVIVTEPVTRVPSIFDGILPPEIIDMIPSMGGLLGDPIILAAIGGVVLLLLILVVLKRRKGGSDDESGITVSGDDDLFAGEDDEELTPIHLADGVEPAAETDINLPVEEDSIVEEPTIEKPAAAPDEDLSATAGISPTEMPEPEAPAPAAASSEQDDVLNEVDVYLAYGLYDNAEELLNSNLAENPERADYRSKLLDTYFATKNTDSFVKEAEKLKSMGDVATGYWDRVQIMGYELAPDNPLFSDAKDSDMSAADLEITKPQEADFDLGASEDDDTNFSTTDFNLGEEDTGGDFSDTANMGEAGEIAATQQIPQLDALPELSDEDDTNLRTEAASTDGETGLELPDDIGDELEFSMDDSAAGGSDATGVIELPDELDLDAADAAEKVDMDEMAMEFDIDAEEAAALDDAAEVDIGAEFDAALEEADDLDLDNSEMAAFEDNVVGGGDSDIATDEDAVELGIPDEDEVDYAPTSIVTPNYEDTEVVPDLAPAEDEDASEIDLGMEDTAMMGMDETSLATSELNLDTGELKLPNDEEIDDDEDISIIDFGGEDFVEPTDIIESVEGDDDGAALDVEAEDVKTGTFAPGDFEEPTAATESLSDIDDIGDLMLPDDVDEVSTKLDLARAFIDMGDTEGARGSLEEVMSEGNEEQKAEAKALLDQI
jgi:pilus assembly protein FimV